MERRGHTLMRASRRRTGPASPFGRRILAAECRQWVELRLLAVRLGEVHLPPPRPGLERSLPDVQDCTVSLNSAGVFPVQALNARMKLFSFLNPVAAATCFTGFALR